MMMLFAPFVMLKIGTYSVDQEAVTGRLQYGRQTTLALSRELTLEFKLH